MDYYLLLLSKMSKEELEENILKKIGDFHGYLSKDAAINLIAKENGLYEQEVRFLKIKEIRPGQKEANLNATIMQISPIQNTASGKKFKEILIKDDSGTIPVVFWESSLGLTNKLSIGDEIILEGTYEKYSKLNFGYKSKISIARKKEFRQLKDLKEGEICNLRGFVQAISGNGFILSNGAEKEAVFLAGKEKLGNLEKDDELILENILYKNGKINILSKTRMLLKKTKNILAGKILSIGLSDGRLVFQVGNSKISISEEQAYLFFNLKKGNISLETLIKLKKDFYIGKKMLVKFKDHEKSILEKAEILGD